MAKVYRMFLNLDITSLSTFFKSVESLLVISVLGVV